MPLCYRRANLLDAPEPIVAHSVNTLGKFGAGVAKQIGDRWPFAKAEYLAKHREPGWRLGDIQACLCDRKLIIHMATQASIGRTGQHTHYTAMRTCLDKTMDLANGLGFSVAMPRVGAGLGGGSWTVIEGILRETLERWPVDVTIYHLD